MSVDGHLATFIRFPSARISVVVLANTDEVRADGLRRLSRRFVASLLGTDPDWSRRLCTETHGQPLAPNARVKLTRERRDRGTAFTARTGPNLAGHRRSVQLRNQGFSVVSGRPKSTVLLL